MTLARLDDKPSKPKPAARRGKWPGRRRRGHRSRRSSTSVFGDVPARLWAPAACLAAAGLIAWGYGLAAAAPGSGIAALWLFGATAVVVAFALPFPYALVSPLFVGLLGWLVDMLPFVVLIGWSAVVIRWALRLIWQRRLPRTGRWTWLVVGLAVWTTLGIVSVSSVDLKHFALLVGIQFLVSAILLAAVDSLRTQEERLKVVSALVLFIVMITAGVFVDFAGVPVQDLQHEEISSLVEEAYGLDAFPNNLEMIKYVLSSKRGAREFRRTLDRFADRHPGLPSYTTYFPPFRAFDNHLVVRFNGTAAEFNNELETIDVDLLYDNVGLAPANTVPRLRAFARNSLTYAGTCVVLFPLSCLLAWTAAGRRRLLGRVGIAACLFGAAFSLARGAWIAIAVGIIYLIVDGPVSRRLKLGAVISFLLAALLFMAFFLIRYRVDPLTARALGAGSVQTRATLYEDTVEALTGIQVVFGFGTERPRTESGTTHALGRYIPSAGTHSTYLNYLFRTGVPGALGIIALYALAFLHGRAAARHWRKDDNKRILATMLTVAVVAAAAHAVILSLFVEPIYTLTVSLVIALAMAVASELNASVIPWRARSSRA